MKGTTRFTTNKGFTLIEIIVILAVISILVAVITPTVLKYISEAQETKVASDVAVISSALNDLIKDTGQFPGNKKPASKTFLCGPGTKLGGSWGDDTTCGDLSLHLVVNNPNEDATPDSPPGDYRTTGKKKKYKGPYVPVVEEESYGNAVQVNVSTLVGGNTSPTWVISAGVDGVFQTVPGDTTLSGDDIGVRIK